MTDDRPFGGRLEPGDTIHYVSLLDETGQTLMTVPMRAPVTIADVAEPDVSVSVHLTLRGVAP